MPVTPEPEPGKPSPGGPVSGGPVSGGPMFGAASLWDRRLPGRPSARVPALTAVVLLAGSLVAGAGCAGREASDPALADSTYVHVMARLTVIRDAGETGRRVRRGEAAFGDAADSLEREAVEGVLREAAVEEEALLEFARQVGDEPERMTGLWERIQAAADSLRVEGWDPPGPLPPVERPGEGT